jgi:hypothetical protein
MALAPDDGPASKQRQSALTDRKAKTDQMAQFALRAYLASRNASALQKEPPLQEPPLQEEQ